MRIERASRAASTSMDDETGRGHRPAARAHGGDGLSSATGNVDAPQAGSLSHLSDYRREPVIARVSKPCLSAREIEVLLTWLGAESKEHAAEQLFISSSTVSTHLARIRAKYAAVGREAPTKTHLFARALQDGYTSLDRW